MDAMPTDNGRRMNYKRPPIYQFFRELGCETEESYLRGGIYYPHYWSIQPRSCAARQASGLSRLQEQGLFTPDRLFGSPDAPARIIDVPLPLHLLYTI